MSYNYFVVLDRNGQRFDTLSGRGGDAYAIAAGIGGEVIVIKANSLTHAERVPVTKHNGIVCIGNFGG